MPSREERAQRLAKAYGYAGAHFTEEEWLNLLDAFGHRCLQRHNQHPAIVCALQPRERRGGPRLPA
jgi:hypothetical protein